MKNPKSELNELCQAQGWGIPVYAAHMEGEPHVPQFTASVAVNGRMFSGAPASRRAEAEKNAATQALKKLATGPRIEAQYRRVLPDGRHTRWYGTEEEARVADMP